MNPSNISGESKPPRRVSFAADHLCELNMSTVPLLLNPAYARSKSLVQDDLRNFRISLRWCALDHSSCIAKSLSFFVFFILTVIVPIVGAFSVHVQDNDPISFNKLVQLPESGLAGIAFFTLNSFFGHYGLRQLLFLDRLQDDSQYVRCGYARELEKAFKHLPYILLPSFFVELAHKIWFFSIVTVSLPLPHIASRIPANSILFIATLASWVYRSGVFLLVCVLFRLTCELQILRIDGFKKMFDGHGEDAGVMFNEHVRIRKQLSVTSHMYRFFIIMCLVTITVSQFGALFLVLASKSHMSFFNSGDVVVCAAVQLSGFLLCLLGAARITHRAQRIVSIATKWHMQVTSVPSRGIHKDLMNESSNAISNSAASSCESSDTTTITVHPHDTSPYHARLALVSYLQHNNGGITLFGFALDRGLLHTLFAFEFSLVLWILSKVVVLS